MFSKKIAIENTNTDWLTIFESIIEFVYFSDHLNFVKTNSLYLTFAFENISIEVMNMLYLLEQKFSYIKIKKIENSTIPNDFYANYLVESSLNKSKLALSTLGIILNTNPRHEGYVLNLNLRQRFLKGNFKLFLLGSSLDITLPVKNLGSNINSLKLISEGNHIFCQEIKNSKFPLLISNTEIYKRSDTKYFSKLLKYTGVVSKIWNGVNILNQNISEAGIHNLNLFLPLTAEDFSNYFGLYFINSSINHTPNIKTLIEFRLLNIFFNENKEINDKFLVNQNSTNETNFYFDNFFKKNLYFYLPNNLFLEDNETYINTSGYYKKVTKTIDLKNSKTSWQILRKLHFISSKLNILNNKKDNSIIYFNCTNTFDYKNYINFQFNPTGSLTSLSFYLNNKNKISIKKSKSNFKSNKLKLFKTKLKFWLDDFYLGSGKDLFSYSSSYMSKSSKVVRENSTNFF
jgi:NADH dehydrogenase/NADH:ubiquinone oxidoreductase subunit G